MKLHVESTKNISQYYLPDIINVLYIFALKSFLGKTFFAATIMKSLFYL